MDLPPSNMYCSIEAATQAPWATSTLTHLDGDPCRRALLVQPCASGDRADAAGQRHKRLRTKSCKRTGHINSTTCVAPVIMLSPTPPEPWAEAQSRA